MCRMRKLSEEVVQANSNPDIAICGLASVSEAPLARRLRRGSGGPLVEDEARQALEAPHHPMGRVDGSEVG